MVPDLDVVGFRFGIHYQDMLGHRGLTHSVAFAVLVGLVVAWWFARRGVARFGPLAGFFVLCVLSHSVLDSMTDGGLGVAWLAPFSNERFFLPWRPIEVSPIGARFFSGRGLEVLVSELVWIWLPAMAVMLAGWAWRRRGQARLLQGSASR